MNGLAIAFIIFWAAVAVWVVWALFHADRIVRNINHLGESAAHNLLDCPGPGCKNPRCRHHYEDHK